MGALRKRPTTLPRATTTTTTTGQCSSSPRRSCLLKRVSHITHTHSLAHIHAFSHTHNIHSHTTYTLIHFSPVVVLSPLSLPTLLTHHSQSLSLCLSLALFLLVLARSLVRSLSFLSCSSHSLCASINNIDISAHLHRSNPFIDKSILVLLAY